jgi:pimeloyl-ACP methyl ester carboxylesterase
LGRRRESPDARPVQRIPKGWNVPDWALEKCAGDHTLADCGHLMMLDNDVAFSAVIKRFLAE